MTRKLSDEAVAELARLQAPVTAEDVELIEFDWQAELDADLEFAAAVEEGVQRSYEMDREYAMTLAAIRQAFGLTQVELAKRLGTTQGRISQVEAGGDMLLSTLLSYLHGAGLRGRLGVTTPSGERIDVDLDAMVSVKAERPAASGHAVLPGGKRHA